MNIEVAAASALLTTNAPDTGILNLATSKFFVGAEAWLNNDNDSGGDAIHVRITRIVNSTHLQVKKLVDGAEDDAALGTDASDFAYIVASLDGSTLAAGKYDAVLFAHTTGFGGNAVTIQLLGDSATFVKAFKDFGTVGTGVFNTVVEAVTGGTGGNAITVALTGTGAPASGVVITRVVNAFTITYESGVSTVADIEAAITALSGGNKLIEVKTASSTPTAQPTVVTDDFTATHLAGGGIGVLIVRTGTAFVIHYQSGVSTVGNINTAIGALSGADDLFDVFSAGTTGTVLTAPADNFAATALAGGQTPRLFMPRQLVRVNPKFVKRTLL